MINFCTTKKNAFSSFVFFLLILTSPFLKAQNAQPFGNGITAKKFSSSSIDDNNVVWFLTEEGVVSYDGSKWVSHKSNPNIKIDEIKNLDFGSSENGQGLWLVGSNGATVISSPVSDGSAAKTYLSDNSGLASNDVYDVAVGKNGIRWFTSANGVSAFQGTSWLKTEYDNLFPDDIFEYFPYSTMTTSRGGDTLYVGTIGGGVLRFYKDDVDAITGASEYAIWGPITLPTDNIYSVHIAADGTQWVGTEKGIAKHVGYLTTANWTIYGTSNGLAGDMVNAINSDSTGKLYFGTDNGLSTFDGTTWTTFRVGEGLVSNNVLSISIDKNDTVWLGTDSGVSCLKGGKFTNFK